MHWRPGSDNLMISRRMNSLFTLLLALPTGLHAAMPVEFLGRFSYKRSTEEHHYVYRLDLWHEENKLFGFYAFDGRQYGDPSGELDSFRIKGSLVGDEVSLKGELVDFDFSGRFSKQELSGAWSDSMQKRLEMRLSKLPSSPDCVRLQEL